MPANVIRAPRPTTVQMMAMVVYPMQTDLIRVHEVKIITVLPAERTAYQVSYRGFLLVPA